MGQKSLNFIGAIGETLPAADFPRENLLIDDTRYDAEGDWAFCRFTGDEVYAARLGFTRGSYDFADFGYIPASTESHLLVHLHLMTREGAVLWTATSQLKASQVVSNRSEMDVHLVSGGMELFRIQGWPRMRWRFRSDDGKGEADLEFALKSSTVLPDNILPGNVFSMCESIGEVSGIVRYGNNAVAVCGTAFYDHSRFRIQSNPVLARQWHLYTPMFFEDGSVIVSYYSVDSAGTRVDDYSFGLYIAPGNNSQYLREVSLTGLRFDDDGLPRAWRLRFANAGFSLKVDISVKRTSILEAWGAWGDFIPRSRRDYVLVPLVLDGLGSVSDGSTSRTVEGYGLAEYWRMPKGE